MFEKVQGKDNS